MRNGKDVSEDGSVVRYWKDDELHREDGPAFIRSEDCYKAYYINGLRHREDGPARVWYSNEFEDGPARVWSSNEFEDGEYWLYGKPVAEHEFIKRKLLNFLK